MHAYFAEIEKKLELMRSQNRLREVRENSGKDFSSNDYLCLAQSQFLKNKLCEGIEKFGAGSTSSRLVRGHRDVFAIAEEKFSNWINSAASLFVANGYAANTGLFSSMGPDTEFYTDRLNHSSIIDGIRLSGGEKIYYKHLNMNDLEMKLKKKSGKKKVIVSETVFSMDGDVAPLDDLVTLKKKYDCLLVLDEAHAIGIFGNSGNGVAAEYYRDVDYRVFTMGKSMGMEGAFVSSTKQAIAYLVNTMRTFVFSTAPMPAIAWCVPDLIEKVIAMKEERSRILSHAESFRMQLQQAGYDTMNSRSHIIPFLCKDETQALKMASTLSTQGYDIRAIRPPTVNQSRLRISIHACHSRQDIDSLAQVFATGGF